MHRHVVGQLERGLAEVEAVDLLRLVRDAAGAGALRRADLDRQAGPEAAEQAGDRRLLGARHLPDVVVELLQRHQQASRKATILSTTSSLNEDCQSVGQRTAAPRTLRS